MDSAGEASRHDARADADARGERQRDDLRGTPLRPHQRVIAPGGGAVHSLLLLAVPAGAGRRKPLLGMADWRPGATDRVAHVDPMDRLLVGDWPCLGSCWLRSWRHAGGVVTRARYPADPFLSRARCGCDSRGHVSPDQDAREEPRHRAFGDRTNDVFFGQVAAGHGLLLTAGDLHLIQLTTRRPVLLDGGGARWRDVLAGSRARRWSAFCARCTASTSSTLRRKPDGAGAHPAAGDTRRSGRPIRTEKWQEIGRDLSRHAGADATPTGR